MVALEILTVRCVHIFLFWGFCPGRVFVIFVESVASAFWDLLRNRGLSEKEELFDRKGWIIALSGCVVVTG